MNERRGNISSYLTKIPELLCPEGSYGAGII